MSRINLAYPFKPRRRITSSSGIVRLRPESNCVRCLLCEVDVFEIIQMSEDGFAGVISLGASGSLGEAVEAFFDGFGKANG